MNIFFLDTDTKKCAEYHCDKHVVKMILETAQLLCGVHHVTDQVPTNNRSSSDQVGEEYKINPTKEWLENLEKVLDENYKVSENISDEPINPTEEELIKLENLLFEKENKEVEEKKEEILVENLPSQEPKSKKLTYLNRDGYGKSLRINRI